jgi:hypothetical protein
MNLLLENYSLIRKIVIIGINHIISLLLNYYYYYRIRLLKRLAILDVTKVLVTRQDYNQYILPKAVSLLIYHKG